MPDRKDAGKQVAARLKGAVPAKHLLTDPLYTYAYSGDASYYRLIPALVVIVNTEDEVRAVLEAARAENIPVTFRAAGTSLSGQAITDGVLCVLGDGWRKIEITHEGEKITLGPSVIVAQANRALRPHHRRLGPDPASQASCKIGGVVANNSSGMCCGVIQNTYHTMDRLRFLFGDGTLLDSGDLQSREAFARARPDLIEGIETLAGKVRTDNQLVDTIRRKYAIKNTVGYSLNALIDFDDPIDILTHLMVGSEGTLGFVSEVTYNTVPDHPHKATSIVPYPTSHLAAQSIEALHHVGVSAAEFMERRALATVEDKPAMQTYLPFLSDTSPAVLVELMSDSAEGLDAEIEKATAAMQEIGPLSEIFFTKDPELQADLWDIRKGMFASAGATRAKGTSMLTEDVAVPIHRLADAVDDLRVLLDDHGYEDAIIFGHALAGNLHFQMAENFSTQAAIDKFDGFMDALSDLITRKYQGSLKAEHGTGRAIAPYVEAEWGARAYAVMHDIKNLIEPEGLLNPGIILNADDRIHLKHLKEMPEADDLIDMCIECGFCEKVCPSAGMTLTPRQRIAVIRERERLRLTGEDDERLAAMNKSFVDAALDTCAACNLCSTVCPVGIETGTMIMAERATRHHGAAETLAGVAASSTGMIEAMMGVALGAQDFARNTIGDGAVDFLGHTARKISFDKLPEPSPSLGKAPGGPKDRKRVPNAPRGEIVYFPSCASRLFSGGETHLDLLSVPDAMVALLKRAGYDPVVPKHLTGKCCGQPFLSKGFPEESIKVGGKLRTELETLGYPMHPLVTDASTCTAHMRSDGHELADSAEFLLENVLPYLTVTTPLPVVAVHHNCSAQRMKEQPATEALARACAKHIAVLTSITCCGYAGDKGLFTPRLNDHALRFVKNDIPDDCTIGVSTVSTCATGLSDHAGIPFVGIASLLEFVTRPKGHAA